VFQGGTWTFPAMLLNSMGRDPARAEKCCGGEKSKTFISHIMADEGFFVSTMAYAAQGGIRRKESAKVIPF